MDAQAWLRIPLTELSVSVGISTQFASAVNYDGQRLSERKQFGATIRVIS